MDQSIKKEIEDLRAYIALQNKKYYDEDAPVVSDFEYDMTMRRLRELETLHPEFLDQQSPSLRVGGTSSSKMKKVEHIVPMLSLQDVFSEEELKKAIERIQTDLKGEDLGFLVEQKIDGLSVSLEYQDGILVRASTRGDGHMGEDVTENIKTIVQVPHQIDKNIPFLEVRGEVYMSTAVFESINALQKEKGEKLFVNPRNAAAGSLRQLDSTITAQRQLSLFIFNIQQSQGISFDTHKEAMELLKKNKFPVAPSSEILSDFDSIWTAIGKINMERPNLPYDIDGAVVKLNNLSLRDTVGATSKFPKWAVAYKYHPNEARTLLKDIVVQVGRTGKLTPIAILEPVFLAGSQVSKATLHNESYILDRDIHLGDYVYIHKAGDIIPAVIRVDASVRSQNLKAYTMPKYCPSCQTAVIMRDGSPSSWCPNASCPDQIFRSFLHFVSKSNMNIEDLGSASILLFLKQGFLKTFADIYRLKDKKEDILALEGFQEKSVNNLLYAIEESKTKGLTSVLSALGIDYIGSVTARLLTKAHPSIWELAALKAEDFLKIKGIGDKMAVSLVTYFSNPTNVELLKDLELLGVVLSEKEVKQDLLFSNKTFVLTGKLNHMTRSEAGQLIQKLGGTIVSQMSQAVDVLVVGEKAGSKLKKAQEYKSTIWTEEEFLEQIKKEKA